MIDRRSTIGRPARAGLGGDVRYPPSRRKDMVTTRTSVSLSALSLALAGLASPALAQPVSGGGVCVVIDGSSDTLADGERNAARALVLQAFEGEKLAVDHSGTACAEIYTVSNIKLGNTINVTIAGPRGQRQGRATTLDDLPNLYSQMVRSLVNGTPMETGGGSTDRSNVTRDQSAPRRVAADSLKYVALGYGGVIGDGLSRGPAFGFGYRRELDRIALDISWAFLIANEGGEDWGFTWTIVRLGGLWYQKPMADSSSYYGGALSYGLTATGGGDDAYAGSGLQGHLIAGYEMFRSSTIRAFVQGDVTLPFYTSDISTTNESRYTPSFALTLGLGWGKSNTIRVVND
jgi:hypothetical protein